MKETLKERIASFDSFRFILVLCVVFGYTYEKLYLKELPIQIVAHTLAIDGLFILSGFLIALSVMRKISPDTDNNAFFMSATKRRFWQLWPQYVFAVLLAFVLGVVFLHQYNGLALPFNLLLISYLNRIPGIVNGSWYVTVLFFGGAILQYLLICKRKQAVYFWLPLFIFLSLGYLYGKYGNLSLHFKPVILKAFSVGFIRGLMDMSIGIECYFTSQYISETDFRFRPWAKKFLPFVWEILGLFLVLYAWFHKGLNTHNFLVLFGYVILIILLAQKKEFFLRFLSWKSWEYITPTAYMLFLTHVIWLKLIRRYFDYQIYPQWLIYLAVFMFCGCFAWFWYRMQKRCFARLEKALFLQTHDPAKNVQ